MHATIDIKTTKRIVINGSLFSKGGQIITAISHKTVVAKNPASSFKTTLNFLSLTKVFINNKLNIIMPLNQIKKQFDQRE